MTTDAPTAPTAAGQPDPRRWLALAVLGVAYLMVVLDVSIVNVALPSIQSDLGLLARGPPVGRERLRLTFGGFLLLGGRARRRARAGGGSSWSGLAALRAVLGAAAPCPSRTRMLIIARLLQGARVGRCWRRRSSRSPGDLPGGRRAQQGARHPRRHRGRGRRHRRSAGRRAHRVRRLGVGLLDQRAHRPDHALLRPALRAREPDRGHEPATSTPSAPSTSRPACCCWSSASPRPTEGLDLGPDDRRPARVGRPDGRLPGDRVAQPPRARCRSASSSGARPPAPTSSASCSGRSSSACSSCCRSTCSRCSASRRSRPASATWPWP